MRNQDVSRSALPSRVRGPRTPFYGPHHPDVPVEDLLRAEKELEEARAEVAAELSCELDRIGQALRPFIDEQAAAPVNALGHSAASPWDVALGGLDRAEGAAWQSAAAVGLTGLGKRTLGRLVLRTGARNPELWRAVTDLVQASVEAGEQVLDDLGQDHPMRSRLDHSLRALRAKPWMLQEIVRYLRKVDLEETLEWRSTTPLSERDAERLLVSVRGHLARRELYGPPFIAQLMLRPDWWALVDVDNVRAMRLLRRTRRRITELLQRYRLAKLRYRLAKLLQHARPHARLVLLVGRSEPCRSPPAMRRGSFETFFENTVSGHGPPHVLVHNAA